MAKLEILFHITHVFAEKNKIDKKSVQKAF